MWKLLTGVIYAHLDQEKLLTVEQKGCRKGSRGTNDLLYFDRAVRKVRKVTGSDSVIVEEAKRVEALPDHIGLDLRNPSRRAG